MTEINGAQLTALHQLFNSPGYNVMMEILTNTHQSAVEASLSTRGDSGEDIQILNNLRGSYAVLRGIQDLKEDISQRVEESTQGLLFQRDTHDHPWIAGGSGDTKGTFIR